jgi:hypothetical protein
METTPCETCKKDKDITLNTLPIYTTSELEQAYKEGNKRTYTQDEIKWFYNLYNRVFKQDRRPGCGKCFVNIRQALTERYKAEVGI